MTGIKTSILGTFHGFCFLNPFIMRKQYSKPNVYGGENEGNSNSNLKCEQVDYYPVCIDRYSRGVNCVSRLKNFEK